MLEDIAVLTGGVVISEEKGLKLEQATLDMLGSTDKVTVNKDNTTIVNGHGESYIQDRVAQIKNEIENTKSSYDKEKLQERLAKLACGVAVLYVGANSEVEMKGEEAIVSTMLFAQPVRLSRKLYRSWWWYNLYPCSRCIEGYEG